ncbi:hypothetical protein [Edaphobacter aggregans]|uniref:hypothetical protein n=1 Tax=Edaphobacter aggregans TaxID=570835 RepID=UPI00054E22EB|nr:hypothetical protein [Edaphobacter aggregans]
MSASAAIRLQVETALEKRVPAALTLKIKQAPEGLKFWPIDGLRQATGDSIVAVARMTFIKTRSAGICPLKMGGGRRQWHRRLQAGRNLPPLP